MSSASLATLSASEQAASLHIRGAEPGDMVAILRLMRSAFDPTYGETWNADQIAQLFGWANRRIACALLGERVVGFYAARCVLADSEILLIAIAPDMQRRGFGSLLLKDCAGWAKSMGAEQIFLEVRHGNAAKDCYLRWGFAECGRRPSYYKGADNIRHDATTMRYIIR